MDKITQKEKQRNQKPKLILPFFFSFHFSLSILFFLSGETLGNEKTIYQKVKFTTLNNQTIQLDGNPIEFKMQIFQ